MPPGFLEICLGLVLGRNLKYPFLLGPCLISKEFAVFVGRAIIFTNLTRCLGPVSIRHSWVPDWHKQDRALQRQPPWALLKRNPSKQKRGEIEKITWLCQPLEEKTRTCKDLWTHRRLCHTHKQSPYTVYPLDFEGVSDYNDLPTSKLAKPSKVQKMLGKM